MHPKSVVSLGAKAPEPTRKTFVANILLAMSSAGGEMERIAIWMAHSKRCAYCGELIDLRDLEIDHVIPESLAKRPAEFERLKSALGLSPGFSLNNPRNYLPTHRWCNSRKTGRVFNSSNIRYFLEIVDGKLAAVQSHVASLELEAVKATLVAAVRRAIETGNLNSHELTNAVSEVQGLPLTTEIEFVDGRLEGHAFPREIEALLDRPILFGKTTSIDGIELVNGSGTSTTIRTCREYRAAKAAGYYAGTTFAMKMEAYVGAANAILDAVTGAKVPMTSYVSSPHVGVADIGLLPPSVLPDVGPDHRDKIASFGKASLAELLLRNEISIIEVSSSRLKVEFFGLGMVLTELMRADLDGDGIEEILVQHYTHAFGGTLGVSSVGVLRRPSPNAPFEYIGWS